MSAEAHGPSAGEYIQHHLQHLQKDFSFQSVKQTSIVDFSLFNFDSVFFSVVLGALGCFILWLAARKATSGVPGRFQAAVEVLVDMVDSFTVDGKNILVSGATQAGKTTLLCALLAELPTHERLVSVEDTFEIRSNSNDWVALQTRPASIEGQGEIGLRRLIKEALRMRPSRIAVGEVREAEALDLLIALNSGLPGLCTIHANSAADAMLKLSTLPLLSGQNIPSEFVQPTIAACIDYVVHCELDKEGHRSISEIQAVLPFDGQLKTRAVQC